MEKVEVVGLRWFKGQIDGKDIDSGKVYIRERLDDSRGTAKGYATQEYKLSNSAVAEALAKRYEGKSMMCDVEFERVTNGKESITIIVDIRPSGVAGPTQKAA